MKVESGDKVTVDYTLSFADGRKLKEEHASFQVGSDSFIPGFGPAVLGMAVGEEKKIILKPGDAFGKRDHTLIRQIPKVLVPKHIELKVGGVVPVDTTRGGQVPGRIIEVGHKTATIDANHPLAGIEVILRIKVENIEKA